jgi:small subunit ribosomal protein S8
MVNPVIIDLPIQLKNGYLAKKEKISLIYSKLAEEVLKILKREKYIKDYRVISQNNKKNIEVYLLYHENRGVLTDVELVSKPGRRVYSRIKKLKLTLGGLGITILSTPKGVMTDKEARKMRVGGEVLFRVW